VAQVDNTIHINKTFKSIATPFAIRRSSASHCVQSIEEIDRARVIPKSLKLKVLAKILLKSMDRAW